MLKVYQRIESSEQACNDTLVLPFEIRQKGRFKAETIAGHEIGVFLERGNVLVEGDTLLAEGGMTIAIKSAQESVATVYCEDWLTFSRLCYHLGNRHVPLQIGERWLRFQHDHVLEDLAVSFGARIVHEEASFQPENGAYGKQKSHHHSHD